MFNGVPSKVRYRRGCSRNDTRQRGTSRFADSCAVEASDVDFDHAGTAKHVVADGGYRDVVEAERRQLGCLEEKEGTDHAQCTRRRRSYRRQRVTVGKGLITQ